MAPALAKWIRTTGMFVSALAWQPGLGGPSRGARRAGCWIQAKRGANCAATFGRPKSALAPGVRMRQARRARQQIERHDCRTGARFVRPKGGPAQSRRQANWRAITHLACKDGARADVRMLVELATRPAFTFVFAFAFVQLDGRRLVVSVNYRSLFQPDACALSQGQRFSRHFMFK